MKTCLFALILLCVPGCLAEAEGAPPIDKQLTRTMICDMKAIVPGQVFTVALHLQHVAPFHTYWKNPGLVGMATQIIWDLPEGFKAGDIQWPPPSRSKMLAYNTHGVEGDAMLLVDIIAPENLRERSVTLKARSMLMSCSVDVCCSVGNDQHEIVLDVTSAVPMFHEDNKKRIDAAREKLPAKNTHWDGAARLNGDLIELTLQHNDRTPGSIDGIYFFPDVNLSDTEKPQRASSDNGAILLKIPVADYWEKEEKRLTGVVVRDAPWSEGSSSFMLIDVPLLHEEPVPADRVETR